MIFKGVDNQSVELRITNYEFPENTSCEYDSNWLLIYLKVSSKFGNWRTTDPSLLTSEVIRIIKWFESLTKNVLTEPTLAFLEPNLEFHLLENETDFKTIRILFEFEFRPKNADDNKEYFVDCKMDKNELQRVASELKKELEPYPQRAIR